MDMHIFNFAVSAVPVGGLAPTYIAFLSFVIVSVSENVSLNMYSEAFFNDLLRHLTSSPVNTERV